MCSLSYTDHCSTGQGPAMKIQVPLSSTHMCTLSSAWRQTSIVLHYVPDISDQWLEAQDDFQGHLEIVDSKSFGKTVSNIKTTASSGLLLLESGHELMMGVFGLPASHLSLPLLSPAPYPS